MENQIKQEIIDVEKIKKGIDDIIDQIESMDQSYDRLQAVIKLKEASLWVGMDVQTLEVTKENLSI